MTSPLGGRMSEMFAVAAPFTLLVDIALRIFGPAPPTSADDVVPTTLFWLVLVPTIVASLGQLAIVHLLLRPAQAPRAALAVAFVAWPGYLAALLLAAIPTGLATLLLVLPGLYVASRLLLLMPLAVMSPRGSPVALVKRSWELTRSAGWAIFGFFLMAILGVFGLSLIAGGVGSAVGSVFTLFGLAAVGKFAAGLVAAVASTFVSIGNAALSAYLYRSLATD
jgi:hypothetical protein